MLPGTCKYAKLNNERDQLLCPNVDSFVHERGTTGWESWATQGSSLGQNKFVSNHVCLMEKGDRLLSQESQAESHVLTCPTRPAALIPIPALLNLLFPVRTHSMALCLVWSSPRPESCSLQIRGQRQEQGLGPPMCPHLLPRLTAGLPSCPAHLTVYQIKAQ